MMRIEPPRRPPLWVRALFLLYGKWTGRVPLPLQIAAHVPGFILPLAMTNRIAHGGGELPTDTRALAMQLVGELNQCGWCIDFGRSLGGVRLRDKLLHVRDFEIHAAFSAAERAALRYTSEATQVPVAVSDTTFATLRAHFTDRQIVELTYAIAIESFFNRINAPLGLEAEGFCALPPAEVGDAAA